MKFNTYLFILLLAALSNNIVNAQIECATVEVDRMRKAKYPEVGQIEDFEKIMASKVKEYNEQKIFKNNALSTLPIVFHVVHNGEAIGMGDNLARRQIEAQLDQLNADFNYTGGVISISEDLEIRFCPAIRDPNGNLLSEPGINRIDKSTLPGTIPLNTLLLPSFIDANIKPNTQWNPEQYVNVWIMQLQHPTAGFILFGYAQFPDFPALVGLGSSLGPTTQAQSMVASTDGIVISPTVVGSEALPPPTRPNNSHTLAHEMGHFFGLRHTTGDPNPRGTLTQRCQSDDFCNDTPRIAAFNQNCVFSNQCDDTQFGAPVDLPDQFTNYMDSADACRSTFTSDQKARVQVVLNNATRRQELLSSTACDVIILPEIPDLLPCVVETFFNYPNISIVFDICNNSPTDIQIPSFVGLYLSPIDDPFPLYFLEEVQINPIAGNGAVVGFQAGGVFPPDIPAGNYKVMVVADHQDQILEFDETNNILDGTSFNALGNNCNDTVNVACGNVNTFSINSTDYSNDWEDYNCSSFVENGPDRVFLFSTSQKGTISINKSDLTNGSSYMYLSTACNPSTCIAQGSDNIVLADQEAGEYYIILELYQGTDLLFTLQVDCENSVIPCVGDFPVACNVTQLNCFGNWNEQRIDGYECQFIDSEVYLDDATFNDKEIIYELSLPFTTDIMLSVKNLNPTTNKGFAAILLDNCDFGNCIAFTQDNEAIFYPQLSAGDYYVIVERLDPIGDCFELLIDCFPDGTQTSCPEILNMYHGPIPTNDYRASVSINASTLLETNGNVGLHANSSVKMLPSFETNDPTAILIADTNGCQ